MKTGIRIVIGIVGLTVALLLGSLYKLDQTQQALILEFGKPVATETKPGLHLKKPFMFQTVLKFDNRILHLDAKPRNLIASEGSKENAKNKPKPEAAAMPEIGAEHAATAEHAAAEEDESLQDSNTSRIIVDAYAKYRILDPKLFYERVKTESALSDKLDSILESNLREVVGSNSLHGLLTAKRTGIMQQVRDRVNKEMQLFGIVVVDVRIMRADLPQKNFEQVIQRMRADREKEARQFRAQGAEQAQVITSTADKQKAILLATAQKQAQSDRGQGDAEASRISAQAYGLDPDFYAFYRSMEAYRSALKSGSTSMVLSPDSDFLKYFGDSQGKH